jgi:hypothetical protein
VRRQFHLFQGSKLSYDESYGFGGGHGLQLRKLNQPFSWHSAEDDVAAAGGDDDDRAAAAKNRTFATCRNSVQGKVLIADDRGQLVLPLHSFMS